MYNIKNGLDFLTLPNPFIYKALLIADNIQYDSEIEFFKEICYGYGPEVMRILIEGDEKWHKGGRHLCIFLIILFRAGTRRPESFFIQMLANLEKSLYLCSRLSKNYQ